MTVKKTLSKKAIPRKTASPGAIPTKSNRGDKAGRRPSQMSRPK